MGGDVGGLRSERGGLCWRRFVLNYFRYFQLRQSRYGKSIIPGMDSSLMNS